MKVLILLHDQVWSFPVQPGWAVLCWLDRTSGIMYIFTPCSQWAVTFTTSYVFFVKLSGRMCLKPLLITVESDRHGISTQPPLSMPMDGGRKVALKMRSVHPRRQSDPTFNIQPMTVQRVPNSSRGAEYRSQREHVSQWISSKRSLGTESPDFIFKKYYMLMVKKIK